MPKVLITSALLYANGSLHFGHVAGAYLSADCYARFERMRGSDVLFVSGSDEYGMAITFSAEKEGRTPQEHVDHYHNINKALFERLQFSFDNFSRTTWEGHPQTVYQYFNDLVENGFIEEKETEELYSKEEERFLADRYVVGTCPHCGHEDARGDECQKCGHSYEASDLIEPRSKLTNAPLTLRPTRHHFLRLDKLKSRMEKWLHDKKWKPGVLNFAQHYVDDLKPRAITRDGKWGVPVPGHDGKVFYVWFEAVIGYISASIQHDPDNWRDFWCEPSTKFVQFIGKDNIFFHAIFFPAMTMGQNQPYKLVDDLPANEFLNLEGKQFSKSEGWTIDFTEFLNRYSADQIRYTLAANAPETSDSEFTWKDFQTRCNTELLGKFGNLANRTLVFAQKQCEGKIPDGSTLTKEIQALKDQAKEAYETYSLRRVTQTLMELSQLGNAHFDHNEPWKQAETRDATVASCLTCLHTLAIIAYPVIPEAAQKLWAMLGQTDPITWDAKPLTPGTALPTPERLFAKIEDEQIEQEMAKLG